jgi:hypothetical protein
MEALFPQVIKLLGIIWINIILSGDNAVVIALACRGLPEDKRRIGMILGAGVAVGLRIIFTIVVAALLATPFLKIVGGLLLLWIAVKLLNGDDEEGGVKETDRLWHAVWTVVVADAVMKPGQCSGDCRGGTGFHRSARHWPCHLHSAHRGRGCPHYGAPGPVAPSRLGRGGPSGLGCRRDADL